ncbi:MAG: hypothetical protein JXQ90_14685 [Cyclobacteriaceae bacterium]
MNLSFFRLWLFLSLVIVTTFSMAQSVTDVTARLVDSRLEISFRMGNLRDGQQFKVRLYTSTDNYAKPVETGVTGDVGDDLRLLFYNQIIIEDPIETLGFITNDIRFKVVATMTYNPVTLTSHTGFFSVKMGKELAVTWVGGLQNEKVSFDLYRYGELLEKDMHITSNTQSTIIKMPKKLKNGVKLEKGDGYGMEFYMASIDEPVKMPDFLMKKSNALIPLAIGGVVVLVVADYFNPNSIFAKSLIDQGILKKLPEPPANPGDISGLTTNF